MWSMAATVAMGHVRALSYFFMEKQNCFSSHLPGKEDTDLWLAWLVRSVVATASCPPCALWLPLLSAAAYRDTQNGCGQTRRKQALEQNTKYVLMQTSLIMESKWREKVKNKDISCWKERECTAPLQRGNLKGEAFQSLHHPSWNKI